jgi:transcriptional regulator with XRE-family HTH domain
MIGRRLKKLRENARLSQEQVGNKLGITNSAVSMYENDIRVPSAELICAFAKLYGVSTDYIFDIDSFSNEELYEIEQLRRILIRKGIMSENHDMTKEEFNKAMEFYKANAQFFIDK